MLVLSNHSSLAAAVEVPVLSLSDGSEQGLEAALAQIQPRTLVALKPSRLGPALGRRTEEQYLGVSETLRDWMGSVAA